MPNNPTSNNDVELSLLTCIHDEENIAPILNLVEVTNATRERPICIRVMLSSVAQNGSAWRRKLPIVLDGFCLLWALDLVRCLGLGGRKLLGQLRFGVGVIRSRWVATDSA
ncbi:hypothetical protein ACLOJK_018782 [Asimina triloba]